MADPKPDLFRSAPIAIEDLAHRDQLMLIAGMRTALETIKAAKSNLPGMLMATALVESVVAQEQVRLSGMTYRAAAKAGVDLSAVTAIYTDFTGKRAFMTVESEGAPK